MFKTLRSRLVLLMLVTLLLVQGLSLLVYLKDRNEIIGDAGLRLMMHRIATLVKLLDQAEPQSYTHVLANNRNTNFNMYIANEAMVKSQAKASDAASMVQQSLYHKTDRLPLQSIRVMSSQTKQDEKRWHFFPPFFHKSKFDHHDDKHECDGRDHFDYRQFRDRSPRGWGRNEPPELLVSVLLEDGQWLNIVAKPLAELSVWDWRSALSLFVIAVVVVGLMILIIRSNTQPLHHLAQAADKIGRGLDTPPLKEAGAEEVRSTIHAFNVMQERQQRFIKDRTLMLAAISHDLKTPITKLRLQSEYIQDDALQTKMLNNLSEMEQMLVATMSFARDDAQHETSRSIDLVSLIESICDDLIETGAQLDMQLPDRLIYECRPSGIRRMLTNVIENAVKYADQAVVSLRHTHDFIEVCVDDNGEGIDEALFEQVFAPFYRIEASRNRETGGVGLGLSVVRNIARLHGGEVYLSNREVGGLSVLIRLPYRMS